MRSLMLVLVAALLLTGCGDNPRDFDADQTEVFLNLEAKYYPAFTGDLCSRWRSDVGDALTWLSDTYEVGLDQDVVMDWTDTNC